MQKKYGVKIFDNVGMNKIKEQHIFISNHTSRIDYFFNAFHPLPNKYNFVVGYNEFYRKQFVFIAKAAGLIPKKNFTGDLYTVKEIDRLIKKGANIAVFVEGMNSIRGCSQPVAPGTGKFIKHYKLPVYYSRISGGYMTTPKYALDERPGTIEVVYDKMFSPEELESLSPGEIEDIVNEKLYNDDFEWNKTKGYTYDTKGQIAKNLHTLLYKCPKCGKEFKMIGAGDEIRCLNCENGAKVEDNYAIRPFNKECVIPETIGKWARWQRQEIKKEIQDPNYSFSCSVKLGMLPEDHFLAPEDTSEIVGEGKLTIDRSGLTYQGSKNGKPYTFHIDSLQLPTYGMCTDMSKFYTFVNGVFVEFYPSIPCVEKFFEVTEEIHRLNGGKWQDFKFLQDK